MIRRVDIRAVLKNPAQRRHLMVGALIAIQAREGRDISRERAEEVYDTAQGAVQTRRGRRIVL